MLWMLHIVHLAVVIIRTCWLILLRSGHSDPTDSVAVMPLTPIQTAAAIRSKTVAFTLRHQSYRRRMVRTRQILRLLMKYANVMSAYHYARRFIDIERLISCRRYMKLGMAGVTIIYSSGDNGVAGNGAQCCTKAKCAGGT